MSVGRAWRQPRTSGRRSFLAELSAEDAAALLEASRRTQLRAGQTFVTQGAADPPALVVEAGCVGLRHRTSGRCVLLHLLGPGDVASAHAAAPATHDVVALGQAAALVIPAREWDQLTSTRACIASAALNNALDRLAVADVRRAEAATRPTISRLAVGLLELADLYGCAAPDGVRIALPISQAELAGWVCTSQKAIATALRSLRAAGAVRTERRSITVTRAAALRALAQG